MDTACADMHAFFAMQAASRQEVFPTYMDMGYDKGLAVIELIGLNTVEASDEVTADFYRCIL